MFMVFYWDWGQRKKIRESDSLRLERNNKRKNKKITLLCSIEVGQNNKRKPKKIKFACLL